MVNSIKKYSVLLCIIVSLVFLVTATLLYPGGSILNKNSIGFSWSENFISNLFASNAINGSANPSKIWALIGMVFHAVGNGIFFISTSKKLPQKHAASVLKYTGVLNMGFTFLIVTSLHDLMVKISSTLSLLGLFYITVFILKTKLHFFKIFCIICLLMFYYTLFLYGSGDWGLLAIMQKVSFFFSILLVLGIEYFTGWDNFKHIKPATKKIEVVND